MRVWASGLELLATDGPSLAGALIAGLVEHVDGGDRDAFGLDPRPSLLGLLREPRPCFATIDIGEPAMRVWEHSGGFSLDARVCVAARDRAGLERLLRSDRYRCRSPERGEDRSELPDRGQCLHPGRSR